MTVYEPISPSRQFICSILSNASLEIYTGQPTRLYVSKYPRLECRPVFLGNVKDDDPEYKRLKALDTGNNTLF